jgi:hypothetical protein
VFGVGAVALPATAMCIPARVFPARVLLLLALVWVCDSCAYYFGRLFGKTPLAPVVAQEDLGGHGPLAVGATPFAPRPGRGGFSRSSGRSGRAPGRSGVLGRAGQGPS